MTQNQSYAAFIGLDKSDKKINVSLQQCAKNKMERSIVKGGAEALHAWVAALCARFPGQAVAICLEQPASGLIHALMSYDFIVLFPINPMTLARYREAFIPSRAKDDPTDADFLCELVALHREQLKAWQPDDVCTRKLRHLVEARRRSVNMRTRLSNQLKALLKGYFPQALELCAEDLTTPMACALLQKWPSLQQLKKARPETIRRFYYAQNARHGDAIEKRLALIAQALPLTNDPALIESSPHHSASPHPGIARGPHCHRPLRSRDRPHLRPASRRFSLCRAAWQRYGLQRPTPGRFRLSSRTLRKRRIDAQLQRHRSCVEAQRPGHDDPPPLCPAALPSPELYRIRQRIHP